MILEQQVIKSIKDALQLYPACSARAAERPQNDMRKLTELEATLPKMLFDIELDECGPSARVEYERHHQELTRRLSDYPKFKAYAD